MGLRHIDAGAENRFFTGSIDDARIYGVALNAAQIAALKPNQPSDPKPLAWWDFENGAAADRMKAFPDHHPLRRGPDRRRQAPPRQERRLPDGVHGDAESTADRQPTCGDANSSARALREKLLSDPHRPGYHFVIPEGQAMPFDPNGAIFWKGRYHLFYIFQDKRGHNWGHVSSTDLFHWRHHPTGLDLRHVQRQLFRQQRGPPDDVLSPGRPGQRHGRRPR